MIFCSAKLAHSILPCLNISRSRERELCRVIVGLNMFLAQLTHSIVLMQQDGCSFLKKRKHHAIFSPSL